MSLMPQTPFQWFVPATTGTGLVPADGYKAKFYAAGTTTPKTIYTDIELSTPYPSPSNTAVLDAEGKALIYLGIGGYKLVITKPDDTPVYTQDNISGESSFGTGFVDSFADLAAVDTVLNRYTYIGGYYAPGDSGEGMFYNDTSADASDGGYIQASTFDPTKRWFRIPDENNKVRSASFGAIGVSTNRTSNMMSADAYAASQGLTILINVPTRIDTMTFSARSVEFAEGAFIRGFSAAVATFSGVVSGPNSTIFSHSVGGGLDVVLSNVSQISNPYWFEGDPTNSGANNLAAFSKWMAAGAGAYILPPGEWTYSGTFPTLTTPTIFYGTINGGRSGVQFSTADSIARFGNYQLAGNGKNITDDGADGAVIDGDFTAQNLTATGDADITGTATAGNFDTNGGVTADGNISSGAVVSATVRIATDGPISAGESITQPTGFVQARAGTGANYFKASGALFQVFGAGTGAIGAGALVTDGDRATIVYAGTRAAGAAASTITVTVGSITVFSATAAINVDMSSWVVTVHVFRNGATGFRSVGTMTTNGFTASAAFNATSDQRSSGSITWANSNAVAGSQTGGASGAQTFLFGDIYPAT